MSVKDAFEAIWNKAYSTYGEGTPTGGEHFDKSAQFRQMGEAVTRAAPDERWQGTASEAYNKVNRKHAETFSKLADLDKRYGAEIDKSAAAVLAGRQRLQSTWANFMAGAAGLNENKPGDLRTMVQLVSRGVGQIKDTIEGTVKEQAARGQRMAGIAAEYAALGSGFKLGGGEGENPGDEDKDKDKAPTVGDMTDPKPEQDDADLLIDVPGHDLHFTGDPKTGEPMLNGQPNPINGQPNPLIPGLGGPGSRALPMGYGFGPNGEPLGMFSTPKYADTDGEKARDPWNFITPTTAVYDFSDPKQPKFVGNLPGSQSTATYDAKNKMMVVVGNDGWGPGAQRAIWTAPVGDGNPTDWTKNLTKIGNLPPSNGLSHDRENQITALPGGGLFVVDASSNGGTVGIAANNANGLLTAPQTPLVSNSDAGPQPGYKASLPYSYGPTITGVTPGPNGTDIVHMRISTWPPDPPGYHPHTYTNDVTINH